jgi:nitrite reductase (NADH) small subunit/3-phenylpropionate/trans-cinnamate dioxygenase ferredoxin subunit
MLDYVTVLKQEDLPIGKSAIVYVGEEEIAVFNYKGKYYAIANKCLHKGSSLGEGRIEEGVVICPNHEWRYDLKTGESPQNPCLKTKIYEVKTENAEIKIGVESKTAKRAIPGKHPATLPSLNFKIPIIQKPRNPDEEI